MRTDVLLQPFEYAERVQGFVPPPAGAPPTELLHVFESFLSNGFVRHESNQPNTIGPAQPFYRGEVEAFADRRVQFIIKKELRKRTVPPQHDNARE